MAVGSRDEAAAVVVLLEGQRRFHQAMHRRRLPAQAAQSCPGTIPYSLGSRPMARLAPRSNGSAACMLHKADMQPSNACVNLQIADLHARRHESGSIAGSWKKGHEEFQQQAQRLVSEQPYLAWRGCQGTRRPSWGAACAPRGVLARLACAWASAAACWGLPPAVASWVRPEQQPMKPMPLPEH